MTKAADAPLETVGSESALLTAGQVAERAGITPEGVRWLVRRGRLACARTAGRRRIRLFAIEDVERWLAERAAREAPPTRVGTEEAGAV